MPRSRTRLSRSSPEMPGIETSKMKQSNLPASAASSAAIPFSRSSTVKPRRRKYSASSRRMSVSSSAIRRRLPAYLLFVGACCAKSLSDPVGRDPSKRATCGKSIPQVTQTNPVKFVSRLHTNNVERVNQPALTQISGGKYSSCLNFWTASTLLIATDRRL